MFKLNMKNPTSQTAEMVRVFRGLLRFEESLLLGRAVNALNLVLCFCFAFITLGLWNWLAYNTILMSRTN